MKLWVPGPLPGLNDLLKASGGAGGTRAHYARLKRKWTDDIALLAKLAKIPPCERASLQFEWREKAKRRDPDNIAAGGRKLILDGLVTAKVLPNDGWGNVLDWSDNFIISDEPGVLVLITPC